MDLAQPSGPSDLTGEERRALQLEYLALLEEKKARRERKLIYTLYPETGPLRRELYPKHMEFFDAGAEYPERCVLAANRIGKTFGMGGYETAVHLTGLYPDWWTGRRFDGPVDWWAAGKTSKTTRDIIQYELLGTVTGAKSDKRMSGTRLIPGERIGKPEWASGVSNFVDTVPIRHVSGGWSTLGLKSYEQGRGSFEGTARHGIWLDEEPPLDVYSECLIRTATTHGIIYITFTPLAGLSEVVKSFLPNNPV